ncbi:MAG: NAD-dependent epimerase/dehydratase family protein [Chthoniobacterales bacterium]
MKALVTGGAGFIGSHVADALFAAGWEVVILDNMATGSADNVPAGAKLIQGDAGDSQLHARVMPGCQAVFHLAAVSSVQDSIERPLAVHAANVTATLALLESAAAHRVPRFVFSSSAAVYGDTGGKPAREDMTPSPLSHYAVQKLACEHYCGVYRRLHGLETGCLRYFNVFGPRQRADSSYSGVVAKFIDASKAGRPLVIYGDGEQTRDFCQVSDVVAANIEAVKAPSEAISAGVFNVGSGKSISVNLLAAAVGQACGVGATVEHREARTGEIRFSQADISLASDRLGFRPLVDLPTGLQSLLRKP